MTRDLGDISIRPATGGDWDLIRRWLRLPEVQRWWGTAASTEAEVRLVMETPSAMARLITAGGIPIGYGHAIDALHWGSGLPEAMQPGTWDIDVFVAAADWRGRGAGRRAVELIADEVFTTTLAPAVSVFTSIRNERAVRAYEKAGFRWVRIHDDPIQGPSWMLVKERPAR
jgi:aminoglycoside 6'-N-acetyltransferase